MQRSFDTDFEALKNQILQMGGRVEQAIEFAAKGLMERDPQYFAKVYEIEKQINQDHIAIDESCLRILAKQSPLASNLRLVISIVKINADLERMGDQAVNISCNAERYLSHKPIKPLIDLPKMAQEVKMMVRESLEAFFKNDVELAQKVLDYDDVVDGLKRKIFDELTDYMENDKQTVRPALPLILIARNLERLGDHATNIAEEAIFDASGKDIRHQPRREAST